MMNKFVTFNLLLLSQLQANNLLDLKLEDLTQIEVTNTSASLTQISNQNTPGLITVITSEDIEESGARNLDELLEIYVPSFQYMYKVYGSQMGIRASISDRNNKILLLVNNRVMNMKTSDGGAVTERWFSMLGDIKKVTVIIGPGSPIYGAGAIAGVINIETFNGYEKKGVEVTGKVGAVEKFTMAQVSYAQTIFDNSKLYCYYGVDRYSGADESDAPLKFAFDYNGPYSWNETIRAQADKPYPYQTTNDGASLNHELRHKAHLQINSPNFLLWARFTRSSLENPTEQKIFQWISENNKDTYQDTGTQNQQFTLYGEYIHKINSDFSINTNLSYQKSSLYSNYKGNSFVLGSKAWGEDNIMAKVNVKYNYDDNNLFAFGGEYIYNRLGKSSEIGFTQYSYINKDLNDTQWNTSTISFFGEYQKHFTKDLTMFAGARVDKHNYLKYIYSPRISFIYNLKNQNVFKLNWNRSNRYSDETDLYLDYISDKALNDIEKIDTLEFIYAKYLQNSKLELSVFYNKQEVIAYNASLAETTTLGDINFYGGELQLSYKTEKFLFNLSHSYTKLKDFTQEDSQTTIQNISASVYGFGDDFANSYQNTTKLRLNYQLNSQLKWINSLRVFWKLQGSEDMANYNISLENTPPDLYKLPYYEDDHTRAFQESIYYNTSLVWNMNKKTTITLYGYNLLGIFDQAYNKRNFYHYTSQYREVAPSASISMQYKLN